MGNWKWQGNVILGWNINQSSKIGMQLRTFQQPTEKCFQLSTLQQLYSYSLENHILRAMQQLTDGTMAAQDISRLGRGRTEALLLGVRQYIRSSLASQGDEFLDMVGDILSESKTQPKEQTRLANYIRANKELETEVARLRTQLVELRHQANQQNPEPRLKAYEKAEELNAEYKRQADSLHKQLQAQQQSEKELKRELELTQARIESEQKKYAKKLREVEQLLSASKRQKSHLNGELKSLNELIKRFQSENTEHIKKYTQAAEDIKKLKGQLASEKETKSVEGLKRDGFELKLRDLQAKLHQSQAKVQESEKWKMELSSARALIEVMSGKLQSKESELRQLSAQLETQRKDHKQSSSGKRSRCEGEADQEILQPRINPQQERQMACLRESLRDRDSTIASLNTQLATNKTSFDSRLSELQNLNVKLMQNLNGQSAQLIEHIGKLEQDNTTLVVQLKEVVRDYNESLLQAEEKITFLSQTIKKYEEELESVYEHKDCLVTQTKALQEQLGKVRKQQQCDLAKWERDAALASKQLAELKDENKGLISHHAKTEQKFRRELQQERNRVKQWQQRSKQQQTARQKLQEKNKCIEQQRIKQDLLLTESTLKIKRLEGEIQRFTVLAQTLKKKFKRKLELVLSKIKSSVIKLAEQNKSMRDYAKGQLKSCRTTLQKQFRVELSKFQKEFSRYREIIQAEAAIKIEELLRETLLLRNQLARRDEEEMIKQNVKRQVLGQLSSANSPKERQLKRNMSCNSKELRSGMDLEARRTGFEHLKSQIKHEQRRLMSRINGATSPQQFD